MTEEKARNTKTKKVLESNPPKQQKSTAASSQNTPYTPKTKSNNIKEIPAVKNNTSTTRENNSKTKILENNSYGTGRRKESVARVWIQPGKGEITINRTKMSSYFPRLTHQLHLTSPFKITKTEGMFDLICTVKGGGKSGQAGAIKHGLARALDSRDSNLRPLLRSEGALTRDPRMVERKKYGQHKARKSTRFSKR